MVRALVLGLLLLALPAVVSAQSATEPPAAVETAPPPPTEYDFTVLLESDHPLVQTLPTQPHGIRHARWIIPWRMSFLVELLRATERSF